MSLCLFRRVLVFLLELVNVIIVSSLLCLIYTKCTLYRHGLLLVPRVVSFVRVAGVMWWQL